MWLLYVSLGSRVSPSIFRLMFMGSVMFVCILLFKWCAVLYWVWCEESACCLVWVEHEVVCPSPMYVFQVGLIGCLL